LALRSSCCTILGRFDPTTTDLARIDDHRARRRGDVKALFVQHRSSLGASAVPLAGTGRQAPSFLAMSPMPSLRDRFRVLFTHHPRSSRVWAHTTTQCFHHAATLILGLGCSTCSIRPSRSAPNAAVLLFSRGYRYSPVLQPITSTALRAGDPSRACDTSVGIGVRVRPWSFGSPISGRARDLDPTSHLPARGHSFKLASYSRTTLAVLVRRLARRLGMQPPISTTHPFMTRCSHTGNSRLSPKAFGIA